MEKGVKTVFVALSETYKELWEGEEMPAKLVDCSDLEGTVGYLDPGAGAVISSRLAPYKDAFLRFIDSGDFHYMSCLRAMDFSSSYALVLFDHHPDMQAPAFGNVLSCGGWVRTLLEEDPFLREVRIIGITPELVGETAGYDDRVKVYTRDEVSGDMDLTLRFPAFISIDKDVLSPLFSRTDWDQGTMTMDILCTLVESIFRTNKVLGVDVCGELTLAKGAGREDQDLNRDSNTLLLNLINNLYICTQ